MKIRQVLATSIGAVSLVALSASAVNTTVNDLWGPNGSPGPEWNLYNSGVGTRPGNGIMEYLYGVANFTRVNDSGDQVWAGASGGVTFDAVYSAASQALYTSGISGSPTSLIFTKPSSTAGAPSRAGTAVSFTPASQPFLFLDEAGTLNNAFSLPTLNTFDGGKDHMVTFAVNGYLATPGNSGTYTPFSDGTHYVIAFEDGTDFDYNDLVVEVDLNTRVPDGGSTVALLGFALAGLGTFSRRFRK